MNSKWLSPVLLSAVAIFGGCSTVDQATRITGTPAGLIQSTIVEPQRSAQATRQSSQDTVRQVSFVQDSESEAASLIPQTLEDNTDVVISSPVFRSQNGPTPIGQIEQLAIATSPAIQEVQAEIESLRGKLTQSGLPPNPVVGIIGDDINEDGGSGRYGLYFGREVVRGNKLGLSQSVVCAEIIAAEQRLAMMQQRLQTDVRQRCYDLLVAQEKTSVANDLVGISQNAVDVSKMLVDAEEAAKTAVLQSEIELQNALVVERQAKNQQLGARRKLAGLIGESELPFESIEGDARDVPELDEFEQSYDKLLSSSPEIAALFADVEQRRRQLARECAEPISNLTWQATVQYGTVFDDVVAGFQVGMPIPILNRNQGAIQRARHQVVAAQRRADKKALDLRQRLASAYEGYLDAKLQIDAYDSEIIPKAKETLELVSRGYQEGEIDFIQLLTAQRTYSQLNLIYLEQLRQLWRQHTEIKGLLLRGSLEQ